MPHANMLREAVELPDVMKKESGRSFRCDRHVRQNEVYSLGDGVYYSHDGVMSGGLWEFDHEINTECIPPCVRNREQLKFANRLSECHQGFVRRQRSQVLTY